MLLSARVIYDRRRAHLRHAGWRRERNYCGMTNARKQALCTKIFVCDYIAHLLRLIYLTPFVYFQFKSGHCEICYTTKNCQNIQQHTYFVLLCLFYHSITLLFFTLYSVHIFIFLFLFSFLNSIFLLSLVSISFVINITLNFTISAKIFKCKKTWSQNFKNEKFEKRAFNIILSIILKLITFSYIRHRYFTYLTTNENKQKL